MANQRRDPSRLRAEDLPYWDCDVSLENHSEKIKRLLRNFGAETVLTTDGEKGGQSVWIIRFAWRGRNYSFSYTTWPMRLDGNIKGRPRIEQARRQMGARAFNEIKAVLTAAMFDADLREVPRSLYGYQELPGRGMSDVPMVASDLQIEQLAGELGLPALPAPPRSEVHDG